MNSEILEPLTRLLRRSGLKVASWTIRVVALDWDGREARCAIGEARRGRLRVDFLGRVALPVLEEAVKGLHPQWAEVVGELLSSQRCQGLNAVVAVDRASVDSRQLSVPAEEEGDLPSQVRQLALRELASMSERDVLDFEPVREAAGEATVVVAAALGAETVAAIEGACRELGLEPRRLEVRPYATAARFRHTQGDERSCLLVDLAEDEAELTAVSRGRVVFSRTARLASGEEDDAHGPLISELKRTLAAVPNQPTGEAVEVVYLAGGTNPTALLERLTEELSLPVEAWDPLEGVSWGSEEAREAASQTGGRYGAVLGLLTEVAERETAALDFLHPRQTPPPTDRRRQMVLGGVATAAALLAGWWTFTAKELGKLDDRVSELRRQNNELDKRVRQAKEVEAAVAAIEAWTQGDVVWLDELRDLSTRFPKPRDAVLLRLSLSRGQAGGGAVEMQGLVRDPGIVGRMESTLRDSNHEVRSKRVQETIRGKTFTWQFESSLAVTPRTPEEYLMAYVSKQRRSMGRDQTAASEAVRGGEVTEGGEVSQEVGVTETEEDPSTTE